MWPPPQETLVICGVLPTIAQLGCALLGASGFEHGLNRFCVRAQLAPTILTMLGLSPSSLTGVVAEGTAVRADSAGGSCVCRSLSICVLAKGMVSLLSNIYLKKQT